DALNNKETSRIPWVPFVGCHAAKLIGVTADEYFKSEENIYNGVKKAIEEYRPDGIPSLFDLQLEAEVLGCGLKWAAENPPSVSSHPLEDGVKLEDLKLPTKNDGRFPIVLNATRRLCEDFGNDVAIYGLITGPFTLALHLMGTDIFFEMLDNPENMGKLMEFCEDVCHATAKMYIDAGVDVIAVVDPMTSQISPDNFSEFVAPYCERIFAKIKEQGVLSSFFVCGNAQRNIEEICKTKPNNISIDENIPLEFVKDMCQKYDISFGGNIKLTITMLFGTPTDNINDAQNCAAIGGNKGFILAPGCDMPFATPIENVKAVTSFVYGEIAEFMESANVLDDVVYDLPDYATESDVIIDVITLDSACCAPCQYMMNAVKDACNGLSNVTYIEHKIKEKESVVCMLKLGVANIPTICIDGEIKHVSIIPDVPTLRAEIVAAIEKKCS
ncbi:MAG: uroporphyrinogen decarboxylase family protein, partial [Oscillospiraceae bacterium]